MDTNCLLERGYEIDGEDQRVDHPDYDTRIRKYQGGGRWEGAVSGWEVESEGGIPDEKVIR